MMSQQQKPLKIILIGDDCIDEYHYGVVKRISPEAPVPVFSFNYKEVKPGMAANVKENLEMLGVEVESYYGKQSKKKRIIDEHSRQHLLRIDNDEISEPLDLELDYTGIDAVVISDYNKGTISYELVERVIKDFNGPVFVDTKKRDLARFEGSFVKINEPEYDVLESENSTLIVTRGAKNVKYDNKEFNVPNIDVVDVCGAGDTFLSALVYEYISTQGIDHSIRFAIKASAVTVRKLGVYAPSLEEIK